ncbi:MAG TPA: BMP family protein [Clostridia bacterium]|nr:BMP family protein [Clostridia bacterium]
MKRTKNIISFVLLTLLVLSTFTGCTQAAPATEATTAPEATAEATAESTEAPAESTQAPAEKIKVALILPGSISDASWNAGAYNGLQYLAANRDDVEVAYVENIGSDQEEATLTSYAEEGYDLILAFGSEFTANILKVAALYPDTYFANTDLTENADRPANVSNFYGDQAAASFIVGVLAGYLSTTDKAGTVEGFESADLSANTKNFIAGFQYVKPTGTVESSYVGSWSDVEKAKQTALAQIEAGVSFIYASGDAIGLGIIEAAKEKNILVVGYGTDLNSLAPENIVSSVIWNVGVTFNAIVDDVKNGTFKNTTYSQGLAEGAVILADYHGTVPDDIAAKVEEVKQKLLSGEIKTVG